MHVRRYVFMILRHEEIVRIDSNGRRGSVRVLAQFTLNEKNLI
jgi:hypothetical protein